MTNRHVADLVAPLSCKQAAQIMLAYEATFPGATIRAALMEVWAPITAGVAVIDLDADTEDETEK